MMWRHVLWFSLVLHPSCAPAQEVASPSETPLASVPVLLRIDARTENRARHIGFEGPEFATLVAERDGASSYLVVVPIEQALALRTAPQREVDVVAEEVVRVIEKEDGIVFLNGGVEELRYQVHDVPKPFFHPVRGPHGARMNRAYPMAEVEGEERDHVHHRGLWFAHGDVDGVDFWTEGEGKGTIRHDRAFDLRGGLFSGSFGAASTWLDREGKAKLRDERRFVFAACGADRVLEVEIRLIAGERAVVLGDTKEGTMAFRVSEELRAQGKRGSGNLINALGERGEAAWGKKAAWIDNSGRVEGHEIGVAIFDHPQNLRFPTTWHARTYGLLAANPFGLHDFQKAPAGSGAFKIEPGQPLVLRYRFVFHAGDAKTARIAERAALYQR